MSCEQLVTKKAETRQKEHRGKRLQKIFLQKIRSRDRAENLLMGLLIVMTQGNSTEVTEFFLRGFGAQHKFRYVLFTGFLVIYVTTMAGNSGMILLVKTDSRLQTPMYFFLRHLAFVDICYSSAITPKMMQNFVVENKSISFKGCVMQLLVYATFATRTLSYMYLQPNSKNSQADMKVASEFNGIVIPMLNPLIYSLRNKEVKEALKVMGKKFF
ncbi:hypothetical protein CB1_001371008 [Camelus ferus]|nr:hypothetical protein CB1_001371008 [Camelus ferus]